MNLIFLGPPGAGKGTQAARISLQYNVPHISTGAIFRETAASGSELGKKLLGFMTTGALVPDDIVIAVVKERLLRADCKKGFLLDGFPRTLPQAKELDKVLAKDGQKIEIAVYIYLEDEEIVRRISSRRMCSKCGEGYNEITQPPKKAGLCDKCASKIDQRSDDKPDTIRQRLKVYNDQTKPLIDYYKNTGILKTVDGSESIEEVFKKVCAVIKN